MNTSALLTLIVLIAMGGFYVGRGRAIRRAKTASESLHSLPGYYGYYVALAIALPAFGLMALWLMLEPTVIRHMVIADLPAATRALAPERLELFYNTVVNTARGRAIGAGAEPVTIAAAAHYTQLRATGQMALTALVLSLAAAGLLFARGRVAPGLRARPAVERIVMALLMTASLMAVLATIGIVLSLLFESLRFFDKVPVADFLFGLHWSPQTALRADQVGSSGSFGAVPVFTGTLLITAIAMLVAGPIGLMSAIFMSEYASTRTRAIVKPVLEVLAGIPTVVFGFFAALTVAPFVRKMGEAAGLSVASESALAAGIVMGIMVIPFVSSLSDDVINAVPQSLRDGAYALGATKSETVRQVILPAALPGIVGSFLLAISRAIGETMIVVMAAGLAAKLTANPLEAVTTVTVQIVTLLVGDQEFDSPKTLAAFALGLVLFCVTLALNIIALRIVRAFREEYE